MAALEPSRGGGGVRRSWCDQGAVTPDVASASSSSGSAHAGHSPATPGRAGTRSTWVTRSRRPGAVSSRASRSSAVGRPVRVTSGTVGGGTPAVSHRARTSEVASGMVDYVPISGEDPT